MSKQKEIIAIETQLSKTWIGAKVRNKDNKIFTILETFFDTNGTLYCRNEFSYTAECNQDWIDASLLEVIN